MRLVHSSFSEECLHVYAVLLVLDVIHAFGFNFVENMRKVSRNLGCHDKNEGDVPANHVDVLIPEVIQVAHFQIL